MGGGTAQRYAVVSCHVERLLDDRVWEHYRSLLARRPSGFAIASLVRPPDPAFGEDEALWLARATEASDFGPVGHHTHWTAPDHARPVSDGTGARVRAEGERIRSLGLRPRLFCGGGWYTDDGVAAACAEAGVADCTPRRERPSYLAADARWAELDAPASLALPDGQELLALPTTRTIGSLARAVLAPKGLDEPFVHVYLHDTDLLDARRRAALRVGLSALARRRTASDLDKVAAAVGAGAPRMEWLAVARPG